MNHQTQKEYTFYRSSMTENAALMIPWEIVKERTLALARLKDDWNGEGAAPISPEMIQSALSLIDKLRGDSEKSGYQTSAPHDVYPLSDGNIILEWQHVDGVIERIEIEEPGRAQTMVSYPSGPAKFGTYEWYSVHSDWRLAPAAPPRKKTAGAYLCCKSNVHKDDCPESSGWGKFQLAA